MVICSLEMEDGMSSAYQHLALADVRPGMVLSDILLDQQGQVLLPQGTVLTAAFIALLPRHGIGVVAVLRPDAGPPPDLAAIQARLAYLFRHHGAGTGGDATATLHRYMEDYRLGREIAE
jgi:hypothetical protein